MSAYDEFMKNHLRFYGYYTGKSAHSLMMSRPFHEGFACRESSESEGSEEDDTDNEEIDDGLRPRQGNVVTSSAPLCQPRPLHFQSRPVPRWPVQMDVLPVGHSLRTGHRSRMPERFGSADGPMFEMVTTGGAARRVFQYEPHLGSSFQLSKTCLENRALKEAAVPLRSSLDKTLVFESRFESGNLAKAFQKSEFEYELYLRSDLYTTKYTQWFYFQVKNTCANVPYKFTIVNFQKSKSLYSKGMKPLFYSKKDESLNHVGWRRIGTQISYFRNNLTRPDNEELHFSLTWTCEFPFADDSCFFAHCYPYSFSDLQDDMSAFMSLPSVQLICRERLLCQTLAGNPVYLLTITDYGEDDPEIPIANRKAVILSARVHPGETNSSWMMKGALQFLLSDDSVAVKLRQRFLFKVIPMLNPDGVMVGNYRCSLSGRDLNRSYRSLLRDSFPPVWHMCNLVKRLREDRGIEIYCDFHGHSRQQDIFIYGCDPSPRQTNFTTRVFPYLLGLKNPTLFNYQNCTFNVEKNKEGAGRIYMWRMGIENSYTLEASFCGSSLERRHFEVEDLLEMGRIFCQTIHSFTSLTPVDLENICEEIRELKTANMSTCTEELSDDGGSDSSVSEGLPAHIVPVKMKKQKFKKRKSVKSRQKKLPMTAKASLVATAKTADDKLRMKAAEQAQQQQQQLGDLKPLHHRFKRKPLTHSLQRPQTVANPRLTPSNNFDRFDQFACGEKNWLMKPAYNNGILHNQQFDPVELQPINNECLPRKNLRQQILSVKNCELIRDQHCRSASKGHPSSVPTTISEDTKIRTKARQSKLGTFRPAKGFEKAEERLKEKHNEKQIVHDVLVPLYSIAEVKLRHSPELFKKLPDRCKAKSRSGESLFGLRMHTQIPMNYYQ